MKKMKCLSLFLLAIFLVPFPVFARELSPIVSTDWLEKNLNNPKLVMIDVRKAEEYKEGHIPSSINVFFGAWLSKKQDLLLELPEDEDLFKTIGTSGIRGDSIVVIIGKTDTDYDRADSIRVAWTLIYADVKNVAVLDGAYNKWLKDKKPVSTEIVKPKTTEYRGKVNKAMLASKDYVRGRIGKSIIVDARTPDDFFGFTKAPFVEKAGHIQSAVCLPTPWIFTKEGTFNSKEELGAMALGVVGKDTSKEIIVYCGVGGYATTWWFALTELLGYKNVKVYDGSVQEWSKDPKAPMTKYSWR
jgi:thiosulfate/3-mercaptopyruvate sulfurtransferase